MPYGFGMGFMPGENDWIEAIQRKRFGIDPRVSQPIKSENLLDRFRGGLGRALVPQIPGLDPAQAEQLQKMASKQLGLGLLANIGSGRSFGEGFGNALQFAQGGVGNQMQMARLARQDQRQTEQDRIAEEERQRRIANDEWTREHALGRERVGDTRYEQGLGREDVQRREDAALKRELEGIKAQHKGPDEIKTARYIDGVRREYTARTQKVQDSDNSAQNLLMLANKPGVEKDPSSQIAMVFSFQRMLEPDSVTRDQEYRIIAGARGLQEELQQMIPRLQTGARLTTQQIRRMKAVAESLAGRNKERISALDDYYAELAQRRGFDPFEVTGKSGNRNRNTIDVDGGGLGNPGTRSRTVDVDY